MAQQDLCWLTALALTLLIVKHVCYSHVHLHSHLHLSFFGCPFFIIILSFQKLSDIHFAGKKITARGFVFILCKQVDLTLLRLLVVLLPIDIVTNVNINILEKK